MTAGAGRVLSGPPHGRSKEEDPPYSRVFLKRTLTINDQQMSVAAKFGDKDLGNAEDHAYDVEARTGKLSGPVEYRG